MRRKRSNDKNAARVLIGVLCFALVTASLLMNVRGSQASLLAQSASPDSLWQDVEEESIPNRNARQISAAAYRTLHLNMNALKQLLEKAPVEFTAAAKTHAVEIPLPLPNGTFARFRVIESPMMEKPLAERHPDIKTYSGIGIDDRTLTTRFDITPEGFHAIILSTGDSVYIDPYAKNDTDHYLVYYKRDFRTDEEHLHCFVQDTGDVKSHLPPRLPDAAFGGTVRFFRLALAANGEYTNFFRLPGDSDTVARAKAFDQMMITMNRVNAIYHRDVAAFMILVANEDSIIYTDPATDPYPDPPGTDAINNENQTNLDNVIGSANYDIGHVVGANGTGGKAAILSICANTKAKGSTGRPSPTNDPFNVDYVAHEMGHQFGANHTFNSITGENCLGQRNAGTAFEPGSGSTIMGYAGICAVSPTVAANLQMNSDDYFHTISLAEIYSNIHLPGGLGRLCSNPQQTGNTIPNFPDLGSHHIPAHTPFELYTDELVDPDGGGMVYNWEEYDLGTASPPEDDDGSRPIFRSYQTTTIPRRMFPSLKYILNNANEPPETYDCIDTTGAHYNCVTGETLPVTTRTMNFYIVGRDNQDGLTTAPIEINVHSESGPFVITQPNTNVTYTQGAQRLVAWNVANTNVAPINTTNVRISLSTDGGHAFDYVLADSTTNDGSELIVIPEVETTHARVKVESLGDNHVTFFDISDTDFTISASAFVTNTNDNGDGSLRQAIADANSSSNVTPVQFNIPGGGVKTINLTGPLPAMSSPVVIDGWSQGGPGYTGPPLIELNGASAGANASGVVLNGGNSTIRGLVINRFSGSGILMQFSGGNKVQGCYIGTDNTGAAASGNTGAGIFINNVPNNVIGRQTIAAQGNLISGNVVGIFLTGANAIGNTVRGNYIGTDVNGNADLGNTDDGVRITDAPGNVIGGTDVIAGNIISGNGTTGASADGIEITGASSGNRIEGNYIGLGANGNTPLGNQGSGVRIDNTPDTIIGGTDPGARNVIADNRNQGGISLVNPGSSGTTIQGNYIGTNATGNVAVKNNAAGVYAESANNQILDNVISGYDTEGGKGVFLFGFAGSTGNIIRGNYIGTNASGSAALSPVGTGIELRGGSTGTTIGGTTAAARNVISGNFTAITDLVSDTVIQGNYIGTNAAGTAAVPNTRGVFIDGGTNHTIGGTVGGAGNVISGNGAGGNDHGLSLANTSGCTVQGNFIGTNAAGTAALGNGGHGIQIFSATNSTIGGNSAAARNIISANHGNGIFLNGSGIVVKGNYIGTDVTGMLNLGNGQTNGSAGVEISGAGNNTIGGSNAGEGNIIAFSGCACFGSNFGSGIRVFSSGNRIIGNSIFGNAELGIDLSGGTENPFRVTANDACDSDDGPNSLQNFPVLTSASSGGGYTIITGLLNSTASSTFTLDFYSSASCDASGNGEGQTYIASTMLTTDATCNASFAATLSMLVPPGQVITCTATAAGGSTSEFSACAQVLDGLTVPAGMYPSLVIPSGTTVNLTGDVTVTGTLMLDGDLDTGSFTLTMPAGATTTGNGDVVGSVRRTGFTIGNALSFGNRFNTIRVDSGTPPDEVTVNLVKSPPASLPSAIGRTYTITPAGGSGYSATLQLHYLDSELNGNDEATLSFWRNDGTAWNGQGETTRDAMNNWVQLSGVTQFSPWTIAGPSCSFSIDRMSQSFAGNGGSGVVNITAPQSACTWTAHTGSSFIAITSGVSGNGNGMVQFSVAANPGSTIRNGTITIAGITFTVYQGINFADVPSSHLFYNEIGKLSARGVTVGCGNGNYCPNDQVSREQMAAFIMRAKGEFNPPTPMTQRFTDVPPTNVFYSFIDRLAALQITLGCTPDHLMYCPADPVKREQMAAFLLRGLGEFNPPTPASQRFLDVPPQNVFYNFIDRLAVLQVTLGCTPDHTLYCPGDNVTRAQMAAFLVRAFNL